MDRDTAPIVAARYHRLVGNLTPARRLQIAAQLSHSIRELAEAGLRHRHPRASAAELRWRLAALQYGPEYAERVLGPAPAAEP